MRHVRVRDHHRDRRGRCRIWEDERLSEEFDAWIDKYS
jgi:hypothetical protein